MTVHRTPGLRRAAPRLAAAVALGVLSLVLGGSARAASAPTLGGWNSSADGNVVDIVIDNTTGLAGIHPFTEADFPEAESQFATGPFGSGLAAVFWPGSAGGNFGSLSSELGIPSQLEPLVSQLNDPVKANAQYPSGPANATYPASGSTNGAIEMKSTANVGGTSATAALADESVPSVITFSSAKGTSSSTASSTVTATASSDLGGIELFGGLIGIGSITSTATTTSTGTTSSGTTTTHVSGVTVLGQAASIGTDGLILPDLAKSLPPLLQGIEGPIVQNALQQEVDALGLTVTELPSSQTQNGASDTITSGGVQIEITPPSSVAPALESLAALIAPYFPSQAAIVPTLPGLLQGATLTITLGRATASAAASPPFTSNFTPPPIPPTPSTLGTPTGTTPSSGIVPSSNPVSSAVTSSGQAPTVGSLPVTSTPAQPTSQPGATPVVATPISLSKPLAVGLVILGLLVASGLGYGLWRVARMLLPEDNGVICPLGQDSR